MQSKDRRLFLDFRVWLSIFLVWCIILCPLVEINQTAKAIVGVDDALVAIVVAGLAAVGISFVTHGAYNSLNEYMGALLEEYAASRQMTPSELFVGTQSAVNSAGQILLNNRFIMLIQTFGTWLKAKFNLQDNTTINVVSSETTIDGMVTYQLPVVLSRDTGAYREFTLLQGDATAILVRREADLSFFNVAFIANNPSTVNVASYDAHGNLNSTDSYVVSTQTNSGLYFGNYASVSFDTRSGYGEGMAIYILSAVVSALDGNPDISDGDVPIDIQVGTIDLPEDSIDYQSGYFGIINVGAPWASSIGQVTDVAIPADFQFGRAGAADISYAAPADVTGQIDAAASQPISSDPGDYQTPGLENVFPFCIPFDIYNLLSALAADPVAPALSWRFYVPGIVDQQITIDLSPFDTAAQVLRTVELLAFIIGLAMVTRERFLRG